MRAEKVLPALEEEEAGIEEEFFGSIVGPITRTQTQAQAANAPRPRCVTAITVNRHPPANNFVASGSLVLCFFDLFLRNAVLPERDIAFSQAELVGGVEIGTP